MDVYTLARACARRWYVLLAALVITAALCYHEVDQLKAVYGRSASFLVTPPVQTGTGSNSVARANPLASSSTALAALIQRLNSPSVTQQVSVTDSTSTIGASSISKSGILLLTSTGESAEGTQAALAQFGSVASSTFAQLQSTVGASPGTFFKLVPLKTDGDVSVSYPHRSRNVAGIGVAGVVVGILLSELVDLLLTRPRRRSRQSRAKSAKTRSSALAAASLAVTDGSSTEPDVLPIWQSSVPTSRSN